MHMIFQNHVPEFDMPDEKHKRKMRKEYSCDGESCKRLKKKREAEKTMEEIENM